MDVTPRRLDFVVCLSGIGNNLLGSFAGTVRNSTCNSTRDYRQLRVLLRHAVLLPQLFSSNFQAVYQR